MKNQSEKRSRNQVRGRRSSFGSQNPGQQGSRKDRNRNRRHHTAAPGDLEQYSKHLGNKQYLASAPKERTSGAEKRFRDVVGVRSQERTPPGLWENSTNGLTTAAKAIRAKSPPYANLNVPMDLSQLEIMVINEGMDFDRTARRNHKHWLENVEKVRRQANGSWTSVKKVKKRVRGR